VGGQPDDIVLGSIKRAVSGVRQLSRRQDELISKSEIYNYELASVAVRGKRRTGQDDHQAEKANQPSIHRFSIH
jgi:hypothetical protein